MSEKEQLLFEETVETFQEKYPNRDLKCYYDVDRWIVSIDGQDKFTTLGYNFLYNMSRLCDLLKDELL